MIYISSLIKSSNRKCVKTKTANLYNKTESHCHNPTFNKYTEISPTEYNDNLIMNSNNVFSKVYVSCL